MIVYAERFKACPVFWIFVLGWIK